MVGIWRLLPFFADLLSAIFVSYFSIVPQGTLSNRLTLSRTLRRCFCCCYGGRDCSVSLDLWLPSDVLKARAFARTAERLSRVPRRRRRHSPLNRPNSGPVRKNRKEENIMKTPRRNAQESERTRAAKILLGIARRRKHGSHLLRIAANQIVQGDDSAARSSIERYELAAGKLSSVDIASLQCVKDGLIKSAKTSIFSVIAKAVLSVVLKIALSALLLHIRAETHIYFYGRRLRKFADTCRPHWRQPWASSSDSPHRITPIPVLG